MRQGFEQDARNRGGKWLPWWANMRLGTMALLVSSGLLLTPSGCTEDGLIGGPCAGDYAFCDGECIPVTEDEENCGDCDRACGRRLACLEGLCGGPDGATTIDDLLGGMGGEGGDDPSGSGGINVGAGGPGGNDGVGGTGVVPTGGDSGCVPPFDTPDACGDCNTSCPDDKPNCSPAAGDTFACVEQCLEKPFTTECSGECVDLETDPRHCGRCSLRCPSGICVDSECVGATSGHMVALCMNYATQSAQQVRLLANALFLAPNDPVRILGYVRDTDALALNGTQFALSQAAALAGRSYELTTRSGSTDIEDELDRLDYDVLLMFDQPGAETGELSDLGQRSAEAVELFTLTGGVVLLLTGGTGVDEMPEFMEEIGFFSASGTVEHEDARFYVQAPGDAVGLNVVSPFLSVDTSCVFETSDSPGGELVFVVSDTDPDDGLGDPAVVHRIVVD